MIKVFVAAKPDSEAQERENDFFKGTEGELVYFPFECDRDRDNIDGSCGCRRSMSGMGTLKGTTTFKVEERELSKEEYTQWLRDTMRRNGFEKFMQPGQIEEEAEELLRLASWFPTGKILEKRGDAIQVRQLVEAA